MLLFSFRRYCQKVSQNVVIIYAYLGWNLVISLSFILDILKGLFIAIPKCYNWHFSDCQWNLPPFYSILSLFYIFFWKVSTWDLRPFFSTFLFHCVKPSWQCFIFLDVRRLAASFKELSKWSKCRRFKCICEKSEKYDLDGKKVTMFSTII